MKRFLHYSTCKGPARKIKMETKEINFQLRRMRLAARTDGTRGCK